MAEKCPTCGLALPDIVDRYGSKMSDVGLSSTGQHVQQWQNIYFRA